MKKAIFYFALVGWTLGLLVHLLSIFDVDVAAKAPLVWLLHVGIFIAFIPAILELKKNRELQTYQKSDMFKVFSPFNTLKIISRTTPSWLTVIAVLGLFYAFVNFIIFMKSQPYTPDIENGGYVLRNHGQIIKTLTEQEYHHYKAVTLRGFSGHWIAFYGISMALLFPFNKKQVTYNLTYD